MLVNKEFFLTLRQRIYYFWIFFLHILSVRARTHVCKICIVYRFICTFIVSINSKLCKKVYINFKNENIISFSLSSSEQSPETILPFVVQCSPNSMTIYYNVSLCIVLYYSLKSWVVSRRLSLVLRALYSPPPLLSLCNLPPGIIYTVIMVYEVGGGEYFRCEEKAKVKFENKKKRQENYFLRKKTPL